MVGAGTTRGESGAEGYLVASHAGHDEAHDAGAQETGQREEGPGEEFAERTGDDSAAAAESAEGLAGDDLRGDGEPQAHVGAGCESAGDGAGSRSENVNVVRGEFETESLSKRLDVSLGGGIVGCHGGTLPSDERGHEDDAAPSALCKAASEDGGAMEEGEAVDHEHVLLHGEIGGKQRAGGSEASGGDEEANVEVAGGFLKGLEALGSAKVSGKGANLGAEILADFLCELGEFVGAARYGHDVEAASGAFEGELASNAVGGAGNESPGAVFVKEAG